VICPAGAGHARSLSRRYATILTQPPQRFPDRVTADRKPLTELLSGRELRSNGIDGADDLILQGAHDLEIERVIRLDGGIARRVFVSVFDPIGKTRQAAATANKTTIVLRYMISPIGRSPTDALSNGLGLMKINREINSR